jgi:hypothetical protein
MAVSALTRARVGSRRTQSRYGAPRRICVAEEPSAEGEINMSPRRRGHMRSEPRARDVDRNRNAQRPTGEWSRPLRGRRHTFATFQDSGVGQARPAICRPLHHHGRNLQHPPRVAAYELACPRPVENREPLDRILHNLVSCALRQVAAVFGPMTRDQRAMSIFTPRDSNARTSSAPIPSSVMKVSISSSDPTRMKDGRFILVESATR